MKFLSKLFLVVIAVVSMNFAGTIYVNNNGGVDSRTGANDNVLDNVNGPVATITRAVQLAVDGDVLSVAYTGVPYTEPGAPGGIALVTKSVSLVATGSGLIEINNLTMNGANKTLTLSSPFQVNTTLIMTAGAIANGGNLTVKSACTITRADGSIDSAPIFGTSVNLIYGASTVINVGPEWPESATVANNVTVGTNNININRSVQLNGVLTNTTNIALSGNTLTIATSTAKVHDIQGTISATGVGGLVFAMNNTTTPIIVDVQRSNAGAVTIPGFVVSSNLANTLRFGNANVTTTLTVNGDVTNSSSATVQVVANFATGLVVEGDLLNNSDGNITVGNIPVTIKGASGIINNGTVNAAAAAGVAGAAQVTFGTGAVSITNGGINNSPTISGTIASAQTVTNAGNVVFGGTGIVAIKGTVTNGAVLSVSGDTGETLSASGNVVFGAQQVTINGGLSNIAAYSGSFTGAAFGTIGRVTFAAVGQTTQIDGNVLLATTGFSTLASAGDLVFSARTTGTVTVGTTSLASYLTNSSTGDNGNIDLRAAATGAVVVKGNVVLAGAGKGDILLSASAHTFGGVEITGHNTNAQILMPTNALAQSLGNVNIAGSTLDLQVQTGSITIKSYTQSGGTAYLGSGATTADVTFTPGNVTVTGGTLDFGSAVHQAIVRGVTTDLSGAAFTSSASTTMVFNYNANGQTLTTGANTSWPGNLTVSNTYPVAPIFTFNTGNLTVAGVVTFTDNVATTDGIDLANGRLIITQTVATAFVNDEGYIATSGVVTMQGGAAQVIRGTGSFYAIECNNAAGLTFGDGASGNETSTINGTLYLTLGAVTNDATAGNVTTIDFNNASPYPTIVRSAGSIVAPNVTHTTKINVVYTGTAGIATAAEIPAAGKLYDLTVATAGGNQTVTASGNIQVDGTLTVNAGQTLQLAATTLSLNGVSAVNNGDIVSSAAAGNITMMRTAGTTITGSGDLPDINVLTGSLGNVIDGCPTLNDAAAGAGTGDIVLAGTGSLTTKFSGSGPHVAAITTGTGTLTIGTSTLELGNFAIGAGKLVLDADLSFRGTTNEIHQSAVLSGAGALVANGVGVDQNLDAQAGATAAFTVNNLTVNNSDATKALTVADIVGQNLVVAGTLTIKKGDLEIADGQKVTAAGNSVVFSAAGSDVITEIAGVGTGIFESNATAGVLEITLSGAQTIANLNVADSTKISGTAGTLTTVNLTHSAGELDFGDRDILVGTAFTRTGGTYVAEDGYLRLAGTMAQGTGFSIPNLSIEANMTAADKDFTVQNNLKLANGILFTHKPATAARLYMGVADGAVPSILIDGTGDLDVSPNFAQGEINYEFFGANGTTIASTTKYWPSSATTHTVTLNKTNAADLVKLGDDRTISGVNSLVLTKGVFEIQNDKTLTLADSILITVTGNGTLDVDIDNTTTTATGNLVAPVVNLLYKTAAATTGDEYTYPTVVHNVTADIALNINDARTITGDLTANKPVNVTANTTLMGDLVANDALTSNSVISLHGMAVLASTNPNVGGTIAFVGAVGDQTITVPAAGGKVTNMVINKAMGNVILEGGNLDLAANSGILTLTHGLFLTEDNTLILGKTAGNAVQPFVRNPVSGNISHVFGNVAVDPAMSSAVSFARTEFPVGSMTQYRPVAITILSTANANLGVNIIATHVDEKPAGIVGLPIDHNDNLIARYPDFYWSIKSASSLSQLEFDLELTAEGFTQYGNILETVILRRNGGIADVENTWFLQGEDYDNYVADNIPIVINRMSRGGLRAEGAIFTYGMPTRLYTTAELPNLKIGVGASEAVTIDLAELFGGNQGDLTYSVSATNPTVVSVPTEDFTETSFVVEGLVDGTTTIDVRATDVNGDFLTTSFDVEVDPTVALENELGIPEEYSLAQNYPNPFNPTTNVRFGLPEASVVTLRIYNILGEQVATLVNNVELAAGYHTYNFDASKLTSGLYIYRIEAGNFVEVKKMMLMK